MSTSRILTLLKIYLNIQLIYRNVLLNLLGKLSVRSIILSPKGPLRGECSNSETMVYLILLKFIHSQTCVLESRHSCNVLCALSIRLKSFYPTSLLSFIFLLSIGRGWNQILMESAACPQAFALKIRSIIWWRIIC